MGSVAPSSALTNQIPNRREVKTSRIDGKDIQAISRPPVITRVSTEIRNPVSDTNPDQSRDAFFFFSRNSFKNRAIPANDSSPRGRLMKKIHRQEKN